LACTFSPSLMYLICRFGLLMELLSSCIFLSQFLSLLSKNSSVFSLISVMSLSPEITASTCSSLLEWLSTVFFSPCFYFVPMFLCYSVLIYKNMTILNNQVHISFHVCAMCIGVTYQRELLNYMCVCFDGSYINL
jgi:hypothetical protein